MVSGNEGCSCIDASSKLASVNMNTERSCQTVNGQDGVRIGAGMGGGFCVPFSYGSLQCKQHDFLLDPKCNLDTVTIIEDYCIRPWCYVDVDTCKKHSSERIFRSSYFPRDSGVDAFYSYSTCNSTADTWLEYESSTSDITKAVLGGVTIRANVASYLESMIYKSDSDGEIIKSPGSEYYNDSIPFEGIYPSYIQDLIRLSGGDIKNITYTHRSKASSVVHPASSYTAAIQDIADGIVDMAVGPFWITGQRLKLVDRKSVV